MKKLLSLIIFPILSGINTSAIAQCWQDISAGRDHTIAIKSDGTLWAWGFNGSGQLGDGTTIEKENPVEISNIAGWKAISAGGNHTLAIRNDGTLWSWGDNLWGQVGDGTFGNIRTLPTKIGMATDWAAIAAGESFSLALKIDGTLWAWGDNFYGQLGHGQVATHEPRQVGTAIDWKHIAAGANHSVALKTDNSLWSWGLNLTGQLGDGTNTTRTTPVKIGQNDWIYVEAGSEHTLALKSDGTLWAWGSNEDGELGNGSLTGASAPVQTGSSRWKSVSAGAYSSAGIKDDGTLWVWGSKIGDVVFGDVTYRTEPTHLELTSTLETIALGHAHAFAVASDGAVWAWGEGTWGKIGHGSWIGSNAPFILFTAPPDGPVSQTFCESGATIADLEATGTNLQWYATSDGGVPLSSSTLLTDGASYYASQSKYGCISQTRLEVSVSISTAPPAPLGESTFTFCKGEMLSSISVSGADLRWYTAPSGGTEIIPSLVELTDNTHYYVSQTVAGCESLQRLDVKGVENTTPPPSSLQPVQTFCNNATIADLSVTGSNLNWYSDATSTKTLDVSTSLVSGTSYYVSSTINSHESCTRLKVTAEIIDLQAPQGPDRQPFCKTGQVAFLKATGSGMILWYDVPDGGTALSGSEYLSNGVYYASQKSGACESQERLPVEVFINQSSTPAPTGNASQILCDKGTLGDIVVEGQNIKWYFTPTGGSVMPNWSNYLETDYYASQTVDACESATRLKVSVSTNRISLPQFPEATPWRARMVTGGQFYSVAIMEDGTLWSWGDNSQGALGDASVTQRSMPGLISSETDWVSVEAGYSHVLALKSDGSLWAWGSNAAGQLGDGTTLDRAVPTRIGSDTDWKMIAAGSSHTLALKNDGTLWSCGWNHYGQTGIVTDRGWPLIGLQKVGSDNDWKTVTAGGSQSLAIKNDGTLWVWGKIGTGTHSGTTEKVKISSDKPWSFIAAGLFHVLGIKSDGSLWAWGSNEYGQIGNSSDSSMPHQVGSTNDWVTASGGTSHTVAMKSDGSLWGWGQNAYGQIGVPVPPWDFREPERIGDGSDWKAIAAGHEHNLGIRADGSIWAWGRNLYGEVGEGTTLTVTSPTILQKNEIFTCGNQTLSGIASNASQLNWYDAAEGGNPLEPATHIISGNQYYVSQSAEGRESCYRKSITISASTEIPPPPTGSETQSACLGSQVHHLRAEGTSITWYSAPTGGSALSPSDVLVSGTHYYASQKPEGCESTARLDVLVNLSIVDAPTASSEQTFCQGATVSRLSATGTGIEWYETETSDAPLVDETLLQNNVQYFASQKVGACKSARRAVQVSINPLPAPPSGDPAPVFCQASTVSDLAVTGTNVTWFDMPTGGTPVPGTTSIINKKHYYAEQEVNGCTSPERFEVVATITILQAPTAPLTQALCGGSTVANLTPGGSNIKWYPTGSGGEALAANTVLQSGLYYVARLTAPCESPRRAINVIITPTPSQPEGSPLQTFCQAGIVADLVVTGTNIKWHDAPSGGTVLPASTPLIHGNSYYASQQGDNSSCVSERLRVDVAILSPTLPEAAPAQVFCFGATVADLAATGSNVKWYEALTGGSPFGTTTSLVNSRQYFVSQMVDGCESNRVAVTATVKPAPPIPNGSAIQSFCFTGTVGELAANGENIVWFDAAATAIPLDPSETLIDGKRYYASQQLDGCTSQERLEVTAALVMPQPPQANNAQSLCHGATISDISVTGNDLTWYATNDDDIILSTETPLTDGYSYYVAQRMDNCESPRREIRVTVYPLPPAPVGEPIQTFEKDKTISDLLAVGQNVIWYLSENEAIDGINQLHADHPLSHNASYYATQTISGCTSNELLSVTVTIITSIEEELARISGYPNPVKDHLSISSDRMITGVAVLNAVGQVVFFQKIQGTECVIDFAAFPAGVYFLHIDGFRGRSSIKVTKE